MRHPGIQYQMRLEETARKIASMSLEFAASKRKVEQFNKMLKDAENKLMDDREALAIGVETFNFLVDGAKWPISEFGLPSTMSRTTFEEKIGPITS